MRSRHAVPFATVAALALAAVGLLSSPAQAEEAETVVTYDTSGAAEFADAVDAGAKVWNDNVDNVSLEAVAEGEEAMVEIVATDGWPLTRSESLGHGTIEFGRQAVDEGYDTTRISSHELGHILGLPDVKPGPCSELMSGASAGTDCTNALPNDEEKAEVESNFGSEFATKSQQWSDRVFTHA